MRRSRGRTTSRREAAAALGVSTRMVDSLLASGVLTAVASPALRRVRVTTASLAAAVDELADLRRRGRVPGLLAEAVSRLVAEDPACQDAIRSLQLAAARPFDRADFVSAAPGLGWDPED